VSVTGLGAGGRVTVVTATVVVTVVMAVAVTVAVTVAMGVVALLYFL
jgi:hypothetical protein